MTYFYKLGFTLNMCYNQHEKLIPQLNFDKCLLNNYSFCKGNKTNQVYCLDLIEYEWETFPSNDNSENRILREFDGAKPECRFGHSQITLDDERVLIIGGCGGPNKQYDDIWILHWPKDRTKNAHWQQIIVSNLINSPAQIYCISFVRFDKKLVTFGKPRIPPAASLISKKSETTTPKATISNPFIVQNSDLDDSNVFTLAGSSKEPMLRKCSCSSITVPDLSSKNLSHVLAAPQK